MPPRRAARRLRPLAAGATRAAFALLLAAAPGAAAQLADLQPGRNFTAEANFGTSNTENLDVGDADNDGDLDVVTANGGDDAAQLERIFINDGTGAFVDETFARFTGMPVDSSRDIEFVDHDGDGDLDLFVANHTNGSTSTGAVSRFYVNLGGLQAGAVGYYAEDTASRWGTLSGVPASSQECGGCNAGPFRDWSCDCDFGDLDDDGDLDLFFGSYGPSFSGNRDSRLFLNDGAGVFDELWPWADHAADTKAHSVDTDLADFDGDFDLDVFMSSRDSQGRVFLNNLYSPLGASAFIDITQGALYATAATQSGQANYEVEYGDVDGDGDFDAWALNYNGNTERLLRNIGPSAGGFSFTIQPAWIAGDPNQDEEEVDFGDYDGDGDLDSFIANFSGTNTLYQSNVAQGGQSGGLFHRTGITSGQSPGPELPSNFNGGTSRDGEWGDLDGDGDLDILLANQANQGNWLFRNVQGVPDAHAPAFAAVTVQGDKPNGSWTVVHAAARDGVPFYLFQFYEAELVYSVDGGAAAGVPMLAQGGQQYRGVIPAQTDATVEYRVEVTDLAGNTGVSGTTSFVQGVVVSAPWTNLGSGLAGIGGVPMLVGAGPLTAGSAGTLTLGNAAPSALCALFVSLSSTPAPFKCGTLVPVPPAFQLLLATNGAGGLPLGWASWPVGLSGASLWFQYAIADGAAVCGTALSNALRGDVP
ncbi:MAG TPA: FG-GAP-like repeat-containing protein [Planctomycetota bacterium]|nr:FG-GAP-like repeat-containing protein [Planctomycetota bacterium]